jgi:Flp pilus assembly protein TadD
MLKCPVCRATYRSNASQLCHRCGADLSSLITVHDQSIWHYQQAVQCLNTGDEQMAAAEIQQAIALNARNAQFHALAGQIWARQGEFERAIAVWQQAQALDPNHEVSQYLQLLSAFRS